MAEAFRRVGPEGVITTDFGLGPKTELVVVDGMSLMYVIGAELDYVEDLTGSYFRVKNPNASSSCGCGTSFAI